MGLLALLFLYGVDVGDVGVTSTNPRMKLSRAIVPVPSALLPAASLLSCTQKKDPTEVEQEVEMSGNPRRLRPIGAFRSSFGRRMG